MINVSWSEIHDKRGLSLSTLPLAILSFLYGLGVRLRMRAYKNMKGESLPGFVISIGNLTVGGTGKTPASCMMAEWALGEGYRAAILSRGHGGKYRGESLVVSNGGEITAGPEEAGDEPYLMARRLSGVPVVLSKRRYHAGMRAFGEFGSNFFVLDDAFQHIQLRRDIDLVLMDHDNPFGNGHLLPWGPLREPKDHLDRAHAFILTRSGRGGMGDGEHFLGKRYPDKPRFMSDHVPDTVIFPNQNRIEEPDTLGGKRVAAFAGIARPDAFRKTLVELGADVAFFRGFRDHHPFSGDEIREMVEQKERVRAEILLTTEKDWVRIAALGVDDPDLGYLTIRFTFVSDEDRFFHWIRERLKRK